MVDLIFELCLIFTIALLLFQLIGINANLRRIADKLEFGTSRDLESIASAVRGIKSRTWHILIKVDIQMGNVGEQIWNLLSINRRQL